MLPSAGMVGSAAQGASVSTEGGGAGSYRGGRLPTACYISTDRKSEHRKK